jgi:hypothetical protein
MAEMRRMRIVRCDAAKTFSNRFGKETTLYEVDAVTEEGGVIEGPLKSFEALPVNQIVEVEVEPYDHEKYGRSYTLKLKKQGGGGGGQSRTGGKSLGDSLDELREEFHAYKSWLNKTLAANGIDLNLPEATPEPAPQVETDVPADTTGLEPQPAAVASDDDIPF